MAEKNIWIGLILSLLLAGLGNAYNGLYKRFVVEFVIFIILTIPLYITGGTLNFVLMIIRLMWSIYSIYDTYVCTIAINEGSPIPLLLGNIDIQ